jgi:hypothetical protein
MAEGPNSRWIAPAADQGVGSAEGDYTYRFSFDLTGFDPSTAVIRGNWATDNGGTDILVNGNSTGNANTAQFASFTAFVITNGFVEGVNTLDFVINNAAPSPNPTGLRVEITGTVLAPGTPPSVLVQPRAQTVPLGDTVTFSVGAEGSVPLEYQWRFNGNEIDGETQSVLTLVNVTAAAGGNYDVVVRNGAGSTNSSAVALKVLDAVPGLFGTGVDPTGPVLADGEADAHYKLTTNPNGAETEPVVHDSTVFPIVDGPWVANSDTSKWISPAFDTRSAATGVYVYKTAFDLSGFNPTTAVLLGSWGADNDLAGTEIILNGLPTGLKTAPFNTLTPFVIANSATVQFFPGTNVLEFRVENQGAGYTGLRIDRLRAAAEKGAPPEPDPKLGIEMYNGIRIGGFVGKQYKIEYSDEPGGATFQVLTNITLEVDPFLFLDVASTNKPGRQYRVSPAE